MKELARTSVQNTQGKLLSQSFNSTTGYFEAQIEVNPSIRAPTVVYLSSQFHYPDFEISSDQDCEIQNQKDHVLLDCQEYGLTKIQIWKKENIIFQ